MTKGFTVRSHTYEIIALVKHVTSFAGIICHFNVAKIRLGNTYL